MSKVKVIELESCKYGRRFQSQLLLGTNTADFIIENDIVKHYEEGKKGFDFYPFKGEIEIVEEIQVQFL